MTTGERITSAMVSKGFNKNSLAGAVGIHASTLKNWIEGNGKPDNLKLDRLCDVLNVSKDWLISGSGDMLAVSVAPVVPTGDGSGIPLIPLEAVAGFYPGIDTEGVSLQNCDHYVVPEFERLGAEYIIRVSGSSMYPKFSNGDVLACKKITEITFFQWGKVYVLDTQQGALVKRVFEHADQSLLICQSDNKENYPPFNLPKSEIRSMSIVLGVIRIE